MDNKREFKPLQKEFKPLAQNDREFKPLQNKEVPKQEPIKLNLVKDVALGGVKSFQTVGNAINRGIAWGQDKLGFDEASARSRKAFEKGLEQRQAVDDKIVNKGAGLVGEILLDPLNIIPIGGGASKANQIRKLQGIDKAKALGKEAGKWGAYGAGASGITSYANNNDRDEVLKDMALGGAVSGALSVGFASGKIQDAISGGYNLAKSGVNRLRGRTNNPIIDNFIDSANNPNLTSKTLSKTDKKEMARVHQVLQSQKPSTIIRKHTDSNKDAIILERGNRGYGAKHIQKRYIGSGKKGEVSEYDVMSMGQDVRNHMQKNQRPTISIDKKGNAKNVYEWEREDSSFRAVTKNLNGAELAVPPANFNQPCEKIISFYSDRNLKKPMEFKTDGYNNNLPPNNNNPKLPNDLPPQDEPNLKLLDRLTHL